MVKITRITTQKKNKHRYNIFLSDGQAEKYGFSVDEDILIKFKLRKDLELDDAMTTTLVQQDTLHKSYMMTINFLSFRMRTKKEIYDFLLKKEVDEEHITKIIERLSNENLLDDQEFANMFVRTRIQTTAKGPTLVQRELIEKGVSKITASKVVEQYTYEIQYEKAIKWVEKKLNKSKKDSFRKQHQQLRVTLIQKGFTEEVITDVMAEVEELKDVGAEWEALVYNGEKELHKYEKKLGSYELKEKLKEKLYGKGFSSELINRFLDNNEAK